MIDFPHVQSYPLDSICPDIWWSSVWPECWRLGRCRTRRGCRRWPGWSAELRSETTRERRCSRTSWTTSLLAVRKDKDSRVTQKSGVTRCAGKTVDFALNSMVDRENAERGREEDCPEESMNSRVVSCPGCHLGLVSTFTRVEARPRKFTCHSTELSRFSRGSFARGTISASIVLRSSHKYSYN